MEKYALVYLFLFILDPSFRVRNKPKLLRHIHVSKQTGWFESVCFNFLNLVKSNLAKSKDINILR